MMILKWYAVSCALLFLIISATHGYDEAGCNERSSDIYHRGINAICKLPLGVSEEGYQSRAPFRMNRCGNNETNSSQNGHNSWKNTLYGVLAAVGSSVLFGSMFLPVKKFDTGDGMFFQWMMAIGSFLVGLAINVIIGVVQGQTPLFSFGMTGGVLWATGNILTVPTLKLVGIGMTQTMVGLANAIGGWISGRFVLCQHLKSHTLNTVGVVVILISAILLAFVGSDRGKKKEGLKYKHNALESVSDSPVNSSYNEQSALIDKGNNADVESDSSWVDKLGKWQSRAIGLSMAIISGLMFGFQFLPVELLRNCDNPAFSCNELSYVFTQYVGIFLCSTFWFIVYCCAKRFKPQVYSKIIVPGIVTGIMYGLGTALWFVSNKYVGLPVAFPIITSGSGLVGSAWGVFVFKEIRGRFNIIMFVFAFIVVITGIVLVGLSH